MPFSMREKFIETLNDYFWCGVFLVLAGITIGWSIIGVVAFIIGSLAVFDSARKLNELKN